MNSAPRILIAGIGNIFFGDDAFGTEVARRCATLPWPDGVRVVDFGIRGLDLAYALVDGYDVVILVDAVPRGQAPGTLYVIRAELDSSVAETARWAAIPDAHTMHPEKVLGYAQTLGADVRRVMVIGCEPTPLDEGGDIQEGMSAPVLSAVEGAVRILQELVERLRHLPMDANDAAFEALILSGTESAMGN